jgi:SAM-dependent methyltransferase
MIASRENMVAGFYDRLAPDYDAMTGFEERFAREEPMFRNLLRQYPISDALDAGCGTGFHSLLLSRLGVNVTGIDLSSEMIARAVAHTRELGLRVSFLESTFQDLKTNITKSFDAVFCLGNSLAHLSSQDDRQTALSAFSSVLRPQGVLFIQSLNYDRILSHQERIQSVKENENTMFVRFYDFFEEFIQFNILKIRRSNGVFHSELDSIKLRPVMRSGLVDLLSDVGFGEIKIFGNLKLEAFDPETSTDVFVVAAK